MKEKILILPLLILNVFVSFSQPNKDHESEEDSIAFEELTQKIQHCYSVNLDSAIIIGKQKLELAENYSNKFRIAQSYNDIGLAYDFSGKYSEANFHYNQSLQRFREISYEPGVANALLNLGIVKYFTGEYEKSLEFYLAALEITEKLGDKKKLSSLYNNIGTIYKDLSRYEESLKYYYLSKEIDIELNDSVGIATSFNNIGISYKLLGDTIKAAINYENALEIRLKINDESGASSTLNNLSRLYFAKGNIKKAIELGKKGLEIDKKLKNKEDLLISSINLGEVYLHVNDLKNAEQHLNKANELIPFYQNSFYKQELYGFFSILEKKKGNYKKSLEYYELYDQYKDSTHEEQSLKTVLELKSKYETEKKEQEISSLKKENELKELEVEKGKIAAEKAKAERLAQEETSKRKSLYIWGTVLLLVIAVVISFYTFRISKSRKKDNELLKKQKEQIEEKNKEITDSINYAKRIQNALLKAEEHISDQFPPHFILFKPKDIVSGDFYWALEKKGFLYITAADCTGHGVPGAFMSMLGISFLNEINSGEKLLTPAEVLDELRSRVIKELGQTGKEGESKDGMDMSLVRIHPDRRTIDWAGANNPLYLLNNNEIIEIKANRQPVGYSDSLNPFENHTLNIDPNTILYLFSDGYIDQFGGERGKKYKSKNFKQLLKRIKEKSMEEQKSQLDIAFEDWRGDIEQIDDVCVIGVRV